MKTAFGNMATDYIGEKALNIKNRMKRIMKTVNDIDDYGEFFAGEQTKENSRAYDMLQEAQSAQAQLDSLVRELKKGLGEQ